MKDPTTPPFQFESVAEIPTLVDPKKLLPPRPLTVAQALAGVQSDRGFVLTARGDKNYLVWISGSKEQPFHASGEEKDYQSELSKAYQQACEEIDARATEALKALKDDQDRGKAAALLERAANEAWNNQQQPGLSEVITALLERERPVNSQTPAPLILTDPTFKARQKLLRNLRWLPQQPVMKRLKKAALDAFKEGGGDLPDWKLIDALLRHLHGLEDLSVRLTSFWKAVGMKKRPGGKAPTPELNETTKELLLLFSQAGNSKPPQARLHAHALLRAAGLSNSSNPETLKLKLRTLK